MIGTYKEFYEYVGLMAPFVRDLWEDIHNRPDPKEGDLFKILYAKSIEDVQYSVLHTAPMKTCKFVKIEFDPEFKNGVAFYYIFDCKGETIKIHSINDVEDKTKLKENEYWDLFGFWTHCEPIKEMNYESL